MSQNQEADKLLEQLHSKNGNDRIEAVWNTGLQKITDDQVVDALEMIALHDIDYQTRKAAYKTLVKLGFAPDFAFKENSKLESEKLSEHHKKSGLDKILVISIYAVSIAVVMECFFVFLPFFTAYFGVLGGFLSWVYHGD